MDNILPNETLSEPGNLSRVLSSVAVNEGNKIFSHFCQCLYLFHMSSVEWEWIYYAFSECQVLSQLYTFLNISPEGCRVQTSLCIFTCQISSVLENNVPFFFFLRSIHCKDIFSLSSLIIFQSRRKELFPQE